MCSTFRVSFLLLVFPFMSWLCLFLKNQTVYFGFVFRLLVFCSFVFRLECILQKNKLSSSKLVLIQFVGYRGFSFLSHAVRLWFAVFSKPTLVSLDYSIIPLQPGKRKV